MDQHARSVRLPDLWKCVGAIIELPAMVTTSARSLVAWPTIAKRFRVAVFVGVGPKSPSVVVGKDPSRIFYEILSRSFPTM
jgi:hypothetical protein